MSFKKAKVVMLPTNEKANLLLTGRNDLYYFPKLSDFSLKEDIDMFQNLYFLSDEEIKEGDSYENNGVIFRADDKFDEGNDPNQNKNNKKIIATTDKSLITDKGNAHYPYGIPLLQPSQSFIEKFVDEYNKGNVITEVMVEYEDCMQPDSCTNSLSKKCICPKGLKINPKDNTITIRKVKDDWNREEVIQLLRKLAEDIDYDYRIYTRDNSIGFDMVNNDGKWIEENL